MSCIRTRALFFVDLPNAVTTLRTIELWKHISEILSFIICKQTDREI